MGYVLVSRPLSEPLFRSEAKAQCRIHPDETGEDLLLDALIAAVREYAEQETSSSLISQQWMRVMDCFPGGYGAPWAQVGEIELEKGPVQRIDSIAYTDMAGVTQTLAWDAPVSSSQRSSDGSLIADLAGGLARIRPGFGRIWPIARPELAAVKVTFTCGYGDAADKVPTGLKQWMLLRLAGLYANREDIVVDNVTITPLPYIDSLLNNYTIRRI